MPDWEDQFQHLPVPVWNVAATVAPIAPVPPLFLLVIGLALLWVIRGFRRPG
jgi:hypothetical protein